jgi:hypothetical protein
MANPIKAVKAVKKLTTGKAKALNKADRIGPGIGQPTTSRDKSGNRIVVETMTGKKVTGKKKNMRDTAQIIERRAKGDKVRGTSDFKYPSKNYFKKIKEKTPKVPVKRRGN